MVVRDEKGENPTIICDGPGCNVKQPSGAEILKGGGLNRMGWECHGGTHLCPAHVQREDSK